MNNKYAAIVFYFAFSLLAIGLCWSIYQSANSIDDAFSEFTENDLATLDNLFRVRANLSEHERLLYEYYATTDRTRILVKLAIVREILERDLAYLKKAIGSNPQFDVLQRTYTGFSEEKEILDDRLSNSPIDWDAVRASLERLTAYGERALPSLDILFEEVSQHSANAEEIVESQLAEMTVLVIGFVFVVLMVSVGVGFFIRETVYANAERRRLSYFPERSPLAVLSLSLDGEVIFQNPTSHRLAAKIDENLQSILPPNVNDKIQELRQSEIPALTFDYNIRNHTLSATMQLMEDLKVCHIYIKDVSQEREAQSELQYLANHDPISGIPNRRSFLNDCETWVKEEDHAFSVMMVGFENFELIARNLSVEFVDELIKEMGQRLNNAIANTSAKLIAARCYRFSGNSFAFLLRAQKETDLKTVTEQTALLLIDQISNPLHIRRREFWLHPSIGASFCPQDALTTSALISHASAAMANLTEHHRQGYQAATQAIIQEEQSWLDTEAAIRQGIENKEFCLFYQPKVTTNDFSVCGMEALVRWQHDEKGMVNPAEFIPIAEESGLILPLGSWILEHAVQQAATWQKKGFDKFSIAINISKLQFQQADFVTILKSYIDEYEITPCTLDLEITESLLMDDVNSNINILHQLRDLGVGLSLDDFGTGYSSMEYLRDFPITQLKIDRSFVINITESERERVFVRAMIDLAHNLDIEVVAEGIETHEQVEILKNLQCDELQGYYFSRPQAAKGFEEWWVQQNQSAAVSLIESS